MPDLIEKQEIDFLWTKLVFMKKIPPGAFRKTFIAFQVAKLDFSPQDFSL